MQQQRQHPYAACMTFLPLPGSCCASSASRPSRRCFWDFSAFLHAMSRRVLPGTSTTFLPVLFRQRGLLHSTCLHAFPPRVAVPSVRWAFSLFALTLPTFSPPPFWQPILVWHFHLCVFYACVVSALPFYTHTPATHTWWLETEQHMYVPAVNNASSRHCVGHGAENKRRTTDGRTSRLGCLLFNY